MLHIQKILFLDIETVPLARSLTELSEDMRQLWEEKFETLKRRMPDRFEPDNTAKEAFDTNAGIYAEFGKIVCISVGFISIQNNVNTFRIKSFAEKDELNLLKEFSLLVDRFFTTSEHNFCGHNIKEFDIPYICRRMLINGMQLPKALQINNKKPWEVNLMDTLDFWKFGDYKNYTSLRLLSAVLGIPTSKDDIDGSQVGETYYLYDDLNRIVTYCQKDVLTTARIWLKMNGLPDIDLKDVQYV
ncbi:MAG: 3'-5' exonuclease [Porphyromonadaceae bacterium]|jgi:uncharacterized protein YprB with RNaseH-like and TPR domain|nr:3'-5' exonuclease [Porphyromonadaceae bacterium]